MPLQNIVLTQNGQTTPRQRTRLPPRPTGLFPALTERRRQRFRIACLSHTCSRSAMLEQASTATTCPATGDTRLHHDKLIDRYFYTLNIAPDENYGLEVDGNTVEQRVHFLSIEITNALSMGESTHEQK